MNREQLEDLTQEVIEAIEHEYGFIKVDPTAMMQWLCNGSDMEEVAPDDLAHLWFEHEFGE